MDTWWRGVTGCGAGGSFDGLGKNDPNPVSVTSDRHMNNNTTPGGGPAGAKTTCGRRCTRAGGAQRPALTTSGP